MRIIGGRFRGTRLSAVGAGDTAARLRPTSDRVRESLFNLLAHGDYPPIAGARVLDLFAGTGALGFEALSRGAGRVVFVDQGAPARELIRRNAALLGVEGQIGLLRRDATAPGPNPEPPFDLVFLDPPYGRGLGAVALAAAQAGGWIAPGAVVVIEDSGPTALPAPFVQHDQRRYGDTVIVIARFAPDQPGPHSERIAPGADPV